MKVAVIGWQLSIILTHRRKPNPALKVPTEDEIKVMLKECYRRFREAINKQKQQRKCMAHPY